MDDETPRVSDTQSYTAIIRDVCFAKLVTLPFFEGFTARRTRQLPTQPYQLPFLGVYFISDHATSDGDWNAADIRFMIDTRMGFSVQMEDNDPVALELKLDQAFWAIVNGLFADQYLMNMIWTWNPHTQTENPDNTRIEGVPRFDRRVNWGSPRGANETPFAELQFEPTFRHRYYFAPVITDIFERYNVETRPMGWREEVQSIISQYEWTETRVMRTGAPRAPNGGQHAD